MEIINNAYVNDFAAYYDSGGIINGTQRIKSDHLMDYWQGDNTKKNLAIDISQIKKVKNIDQALYVGRIPTHFGHFLMEGLPRLCEAIDIKIPIIGHISYGKLPKGSKNTPIDSIEWIISTITSEKFYRVKENELYKIKTLFVPDLPVVLSQSCAEPWRMTKLIQTVVKAARKKHKKIKTYSENLYLRRTNETIMYGDSKYHNLSDPESHISKQIAKVSYAKKLSGQIGSNSHISMFAPHNAFTSWQERFDDFQQANRNQSICDIIKSYNTFNDIKR